MRRLAPALAVALLASCTTPPHGAADAPFDLLIRGGTVYPGGAAPFRGDIAIRGDRIVAIGPGVAGSAARTIDARGMIVSPGFIDPHTHMTGWLTDPDPKRRLVEPFLAQGVTTAVVGNDGGGPVEIAALLDGAGERPVGINFAAFTGFGTIRAAVIGDARRAPTADELSRETAVVRRAMCEGALGISTGLFYAPQSFSEKPEVVALARTAGEMGGIYDTHLRDESDYTVGLGVAVDETIAIAREAGIPVHISHIKALGVNVHGMAPAIIDKVEAARAAGLAVTASQYPWEASGTSMVASLVPLWALDGGRQAMLARLEDPAQQERVRVGMAENLGRRGGAGTLLIAEGRWKGSRLSHVAAAMHTDPISAAIAVIRTGDVGVVSFNMAEADIAAFMRQPWVVTGSDASGGHPRVFGSFARKYAVYVRERQVLSLRDFIDRSTAVTADILGIADRGRLKVGHFADVAVFDPATFAARATYEEPERTAVGMRVVIVNGRVALEGGALTGTAAGRALRHRPPPGRCPDQSR
ncbi:amidohydrolase family protein [Altererythrobacter aerius]|uniref:Amidohydrolase family protein n=1 Tax=Tsuneonella aeria TaxID=1837929 RepID=A0A6I4TFW4_9SPHN|nr:amidohydrolase family protein [Tsuneonella aeria]MXO76033.1 amidohydrolase family protein [Tsuneonella aeria]